MTAWKEESKNRWSCEVYGRRMLVLGMYLPEKDTPEKRITPDCWAFRVEESQTHYGRPDMTKAMAMEAAERWASENRIKRNA